jgi:Fibrinogen beta and gamma chains, C-terminal globular domain
MVLDRLAQVVVDVGSVTSRLVPWILLAAPACFNPHLTRPVVDDSGVPPILDDAAAVLDTAVMLDAPPPDAPSARTCAELRDAGMPSSVYWVRHPDGTSQPFQVYCEQLLHGGGWAMVFNSVRREDGRTTEFWQFYYVDRLRERGVLAPDQNYYNGSLYLIGREYMDVFTDLQGTTAVAAEMTATGFDSDLMRFAEPMYVRGNMNVYGSQFADGWSARDQDFDSDGVDNCAAVYGNVAQHYRHCWWYNLGADEGLMALDNGVGPHVDDRALSSLGLARQPDDENGYSQVNRIARFTRW